MQAQDLISGGFKDEAQTEATRLRLQKAERSFFAQYPEGFETPELAAISKKHKMPALVAFAQEAFAEGALVAEGDAQGFALEEARIIQAAKDLIAKSTMVSLFEKPKFRDAVNSLSIEETQRMALGLYELIHGDEVMGFELLTGLLMPYGIAKWPVLTAFRCYYHPTTDFLVKPTTVKGVIRLFGWDDLVYPTKPSMAFYNAYRQRIQWLASQASPLLSPTMAHFSGFLMMQLEEVEGDA